MNLVWWCLKDGWKHDKGRALATGIAVLALSALCFAALAGCAIPEQGIGYVIYDGQTIQTGLCDLDDTLVADRQGGKCIAPVTDGE